MAWGALVGMARASVPRQASVFLQADRSGREKSIRTLQATLSEARKVISKARTLYQVSAINPNHPGAVRERA